MFAAPIVFELIIGIGTFHIPVGDQNTQFNEDNGLLAARVGPVIVGTFENSYHQRTNFFGGVAEWEYDGLVWGLSYGAMHGYCSEAFKFGKPFNWQNCDPEWMPYISPYFGIRYEAVTVRAHSFASAVTLSVSINLGDLYESSSDRFGFTSYGAGIVGDQRGDVSGQGMESGPLLQYGRSTGFAERPGY